MMQWESVDYPQIVLHSAAMLVLGWAHLWERQVRRNEEWVAGIVASGRGKVEGIRSEAASRVATR